MMVMSARLFAAATIALAAHCAFADQYSIAPSIESRVNWTDNINLTPGVNDGIVGLVAASSMGFARNSGAAELSGSARVGINRYPGNSDLDTEDARLTLGSRWQSERVSSGLSAAYSRDSTLQSELETTGIVQVRRQRDLVSLEPSWGYSLTERASVFTRYQADWVSYDAGAGLENYTNQQATGGYTYLLLRRTAATFSARHNRYRDDSGRSRTNTNGFNLDLTHDATARLKLALGIGSRRSEIERTSCPFSDLLCETFGSALLVTTDTKDEGQFCNVSINYAWLRTRANVAASRDINATGGGFLVETDRFGIKLGHDFGEKLSASLDGVYLRSRSIGGTGGESRYFSLGSNLSWKLTQGWTAAAGYSYAYQEESLASQHAAANSAYLSLSYNWPEISLSR